MTRIFKTTCMILLVVCIALSFSISPAFSAELKMGYIDVRKAYFEYDKTKTLEADLNKEAEGFQQKRDAIITTITQARDEGELLAGEARKKKQREIDLKLAELQEFDKTTRQTLLNKRNDIMVQVMEEIGVIAEDIGEKGKYDFVLESRNVMYASEKYDLTAEVIKRLNK
jgi:outer membrane protein